MSIICIKLPALLNWLKLPLYRNALFILLVNMLPGAIGIVFWGLVSRFYSVSDVGLGAGVISAFVLVSSIAGLGINAVVIRFLADAKDAVHFLNSLYTIVLFASVLIGTIFLIGIPLWTPELNILRTSGTFSMIFMVSLVVSSLSTLVVSTFIAQHSSQFSLLFTLISNISRLILVLFFIHYGAQGIVISVTISYFSAAIVMMVFFLTKVIHGYRLSWVWDMALYKKVFPYSIVNYLSMIAQQSIQTIIPVMILGLLGPEANAYAYIPLMLSYAVTSVGYSLATSALAEGASQISNAHSVINKSMIVGLSVSVFLTLVALIGAPFFMKIFGPKYVEESTGLFRLAALAGPFMVLNQNYYTKLYLDQKLQQLIMFNILTLVVILGIAYAWLPKLGIEASGIGLLFGNGVLSFCIVIINVKPFLQNFSI